MGHQWFPYYGICNALRRALLDESGGINFLKSTIREVDSLKIDPYFTREGLAELLLRTTCQKGLLES